MNYKNFYDNHCNCKRNVEPYRRKQHHTCYCDCENHIQLNFSGLTDNLNFKLLRNRHRLLEIATTARYKIKGKTQHVGIDYVDINRNGTTITVLKDKIDHIKWISNNC